jgi:PAS domain S-box-containing protein
MYVQPLRRLLTYQSLLAIILPFGLVLLIGSLWIVPQIRKNAESRNLQLARAVGMQVESHLETCAALVRASATMPRDSMHMQHGFQQHLDALLKSTDALSSLYDVDPDGKVYAVAIKNVAMNHRDDLVNLSLSHNPLFQDVLQSKKPLWSETFLSMVNGGLVTAYAAPGDGTIVIGEVDLALLTKFLTQISSEEDTLILIVDHNGQVVADNNGLYTAQQLNIANIPLVRTGVSSAAPATAQFDFAGRSMTGSIIRIPTVNWHVLVARTDASLFHTSQNILQVILTGILFALCCSALASVYQARRLAIRFGDLARHAQDIAQGCDSGEWPLSGISEFNQLSGNLQIMARRLQDSEALYRALFEQTPDGIILWSIPELKPVQFNTAAHTLLGYSRDEFASLSVMDILDKQRKTVFSDTLEQLRREGTVSAESTHLTKSGDSSSMFVTLQLFELEGHQMLLAIHRDINELKESTRTLELYRYALDNARDAIYLVQSDARFIYVNKAACETLGYTSQELMAMHVFDIDPDFPCDMWAKHWQDIKAHDALRIERQHRANDGRLIPVEIGVRQFVFEGTEYLLSAARDLTERRQFEEERHKLEQQLLHAQKLESLGVLAGGIAHDFNNILMAVIGNAELGLIRLNKESPAVENLQRIEQAAARAADLAKQMLAYSGKGKFVIESLDLNLLLDEMLHMLEVSISKKAVLRLNLNKNIPTVDVDATQVRQIIMNLVINASEAIGDKSGIIAIGTGCMDCDNNYLKDVWLNENLSDGLYVYLEIADTGCGMDRETKAKIFDPFFTTKFTGRGLGMAAVLGIVRGHKGAIKVYSEPGKGSTFKILLPASGRPAELFNHVRNVEDWRYSGTVLLVDDEETVRGIGKEMLQELGFTAITANDGLEAIEVFKATPDIVLVILDLTMPHMDGEQCFRELRQLRPDLKVIMSSGYNEQEVTQKFVGKGLAGFVQKPYKLSVLKEAIAPLVSPIKSK